MKTQTFTAAYGYEDQFKITLDGGEGEPWPITLEHPENIGGIPLSRKEALALIEALKDALDFDPASFVRVSFSGSSGWTYHDPSGSLTVGDLVQAPYGSTNRLRVGTVTELGRSGYDGLTKDVFARVTTEPLAAA